MFDNYPVNLVPFSTISQYIIRYDHYNFQTWFNNLFGNILAFMLLGFLLPVLFGKIRRAWKILLLSYLVSIGVETIQLFFHVGSFDIDDIILNTAGGGLGYIVLSISLKGKSYILNQGFRKKRFDSSKLEQSENAKFEADRLERVGEGKYGDEGQESK